MMIGLAILMAVAICGTGCTAESLRKAIETQHRANEVEEKIFEEQHDALCILTFRDLANQLQVGATALSEPQKSILNRAWNERDTIEFWSVQHERAKALRAAGVDAKLYSDQSTVDLLLKSLEAKEKRAEQGIAAAIAAASGSALPAASRPFSSP
jgi:hypothetical protein